SEDTAQFQHRAAALPANIGRQGNDAVDLVRDALPNKSTPYGRRGRPRQQNSIAAAAKRLGLLHELLPGAARFAVLYPFLKKLFADGGYQGPDFQKALAKILPQLETEIVKRSDRTKGFVVLPRRWVVERTFAWLNRCRRLAKDWENLNRNALAFLRLASI